MNNKHIKFMYWVCSGDVNFDYVVPSDTCSTPSISHRAPNAVMSPTVLVVSSQHTPTVHLHHSCIHHPSTHVLSCMYHLNPHPNHVSSYHHPSLTPSSYPCICIIQVSSSDPFITSHVSSPTRTGRRLRMMHVRVGGWCM